MCVCVCVCVWLQTHSVNKPIADLAATDLRNYQWRMNGTSWAGKEVSLEGCVANLNEAVRQTLSGTSNVNARFPV